MLTSVLGKSWITSALGIIGALCGTLKMQGVSIGHVGKGDWIDLVAVLCAAGLGLAAKQWNVHSTQTEVQQSTLKAEQAVQKPSA